MHHTLRRLLPDRLSENAAGMPALAAVVAGFLAVLTLWLDHTAGAGLLPASMQWTASNARTLLGSLVGAIVTVAGFTFWMRAVMVQLVSSEFSPRVLSVYLEDDFQRTVTAFMVGALMYVIIVLGAIPADGDIIPVVSVAVSIVVTLAAVVSILVAIKNGVRALEVSELVRRMTDTLIDQIEAGARELSPPTVVGDDGPTGLPVHVTQRGWIQRIDRHRMLTALPPGATLRLTAKVGDFIDVDQVLGHVTGGDADLDRIRSAVTVGRVRTGAQDLSFRFQQLVDVAEQALATGSTDSTTAYEVIVHLGAALRALMRAGAPQVDVVDGDRRVLAPNEPSETDLVREVVGRLRLEIVRYPTVVEHLLRVLAGVRDTAAAHGRDDAVAELVRQAVRLLDGAAGADLVPSDLEDLRAFAAENQLLVAA